MLNMQFRRWTQKVGILLVGLLIFFAFLCLMGRVLSLFSEQSKPLVEHLASRVFHRPVQLQKFNLHWHGLRPVFEMQGVRVQTHATSHSLLEVQQLSFSVNLWRSFWRRTPLPSHLMIQGAHLVIQQGVSGHWQLLGLDRLTRPNSRSLGSLGSFYWLVKHCRAHFIDINFELQFYSGKKIYLRRLDLSVRDDKIEAVGALGTLDQLKDFHFSVQPTVFAKNWNAFSAKIYFKTTGLNSELLINEFGMSDYTKPIKLHVNSVGAEVWANLDNGKLSEVRGDFSGDGLTLTNSKAHQSLVLDSINSQFQWTRRQNTWSLMLNNFKTKEGGRLWKTRQIALRWQKKDRIVENILHVDQLALDQVKAVFQLLGRWNKKISTWEARLKPNALLHDVELVGHSQPQRLPSFSLQTRFSGLRTQAYQKIPGVSAVSGKLMMNDKHGVVWINSRQVGLDSSYLFKESVGKTQLKLTLAYRYEKEHVSWQIPTFELDNGNLHFCGEAHNLAKDFSLEGKFSVKDAGKMSPYLPNHIIPERLYHWLRHAFKGGVINSGNVVLSRAKEKLRLRLGMQVKDLSLMFSPMWPVLNHLDGWLEFSDKSMVVRTDKGAIAGASLQRVVAKIPNLSNPVLFVNGEAEGSAQQGLDFLHQSPLRFGQYANAYQGEGVVNLHIKLQKSLGQRSMPSKVLGQLFFKKDTFRSVSSTLPLTDVQGELDFSNNAVWAKKINGKINGNPWFARVDTPSSPTLKSPLHYPAFAVYLSGSWDFDLLKKDVKTILQGEVLYRGLLHITDTGHSVQSTLNLMSDLKGAQINLPAPYGKKIQRAQMARLELQENPDKTTLLKLDYSGLVKVAMRYQCVGRRDRFIAAKVHLGQGQMGALPQSGVIVDGFVPMFSWRQWKSQIENFLTYQEKSSDVFDISLLRKLDLEVKQFSFNGTYLPNLYITYMPSALAYHLGLSSEKIAGKVVIPFDHKKVWSVFLDRLNLGSLNVAKISHNPGLGAIPGFDLVCKDCVLGKHSLGEVSMQVRTNSHGVDIPQLDFSNSFYTLKARGGWDCSKGQCQSQVKGLMVNNSLATVLQDFGISNALYGGVGTMSFSLDWDGLPQQFSWQKTTGSFTFAYHEGRILSSLGETQSKLGLGKVINLLSLQFLPKILVSGFKREGVRGFGFDDFSGTVTVQNGIGHIGKIALLGPIAWAKINGDVNLMSQEYHLSMHVVPNMTSSLPLIIGFASGPFAGVVSWFADKLLAPKIGEIMAKDYIVRGAISHPIVIQKKSRKAA